MPTATTAANAALNAVFNFDLLAGSNKKWISLTATRHAFVARIRAALQAARHPANTLDAARHVDGTHVMAHSLQRGNHRLERRALLDLRRTVAAVEVRQVDRRLHVHLPVGEADERLGHVADDEAAAGA